jgi:hypothetical protein
MNKFACDLIDRAVLSGLGKAANATSNSSLELIFNTDAQNGADEGTMTDDFIDDEKARHVIPFNS